MEISASMLLPFWGGVSAGIFFVLFFVERMSFIMLTILFNAFFGDDEASTYPAMQAFGSFMSVGVGLFAGVVQTLTS
eukprot:2434352-Rhodomonas_salina.1